MHRSSFSIIGRLIILIGPLMTVMIIAILMGVLGFVCSTFITVFGGFALLSASGTNSFMDIHSILISVIVMAFLRGILRYGEQLSGHYIAFKLLAILRDKVFKALRRLSPAKLEGKDKGNLISLITSDIELLEVFYAHTIAPVSIAIITSLIMVIFIGTYNIILAGVAALAYLTVGFIIPTITSPAGRQHGRKYRESFGRLSSYLLESLRGMKESIQYCWEEKRLEEIDSITDEMDQSQRSLKRHEGMTKAVTDTMILGFSLCILFVGLYLQSKGEIGFKDVLIPTIALFSSFGPVAALSSLSNNLLQVFASGERVLDILDEHPQVEDVTEGKDLNFQDIICDKISFAYQEERILRNVNLHIPKNSITGIMGKTGSGKSTLLKLIMRFWDVQRGTVKISGEDIRNINTKTLRNLLSFVTQDTFLFNDTIEENIRMGKKNVSEKDVEGAAKKASIHDFIMTLPNGYKTNVGELGDRLSGGERQRIGIARAFLHNAPLMLLDEPTSNLDSLNEAIVLKALYEQRENRTIIIVSHRNSTMSIADRIHHMQGGYIS
ncbi:MAG: ABC transporter ATP-binding protein/permease [Maledivibacter sp.]|nr:ABC transporter ATP-binding protein/permease [Maledivibacter sp.]